MIFYLLQSAACLLAFYLLYITILSKTTFFRLNRFYLLAALPLSLIIPALSIPVLPSSPATLDIALYGNNVMNENNAEAANATLINMSYTEIFGIIYLLGILVTAIYFMVKIISVLKLVRQHPGNQHQDLHLVYYPGHHNFSFFSNVFLNENLKNDPDARDKVLEHETAHAKLGHTLDILWVELMKLVFWFNPIIYLWKKELQLLHEYQADQSVNSRYPGQTDDYIQLIVNQLAPAKTLALSNQFSKSLIKNRIIMMTRNNAHRTGIWRYATILPVLFVLLFAFACTENETPEVENHFVKREVAIVMKEDGTFDTLVNETVNEWVTEDEIDERLEHMESDIEIEIDEIAGENKKQLKIMKRVDGEGDTIVKVFNGGVEIKDIDGTMHEFLEKHGIDPKLIEKKPDTH